MQRMYESIYQHNLKKYVSNVPYLMEKGGEEESGWPHQLPL